MLDKLRPLAIFAKAIDHGSFRGAAAELRLSPSVVSHQISQLEEDLGVALIYRSTRKLRLTQEGAVLLEAARRMLAAVEPELAQLSASGNEPSGELNVTAPAVLSLSVLTEAIAAFAKKYPKVSLSIDFSDARRDIIDDGLDIAIRMGKRQRRSATQRRLFFVERALVASREYAAQQRPCNDPQELEAWDWIALTPVRKLPVEFHHETEASVRINPKAKLTTNDAQALYRLARAGAGLAIVPEFLAAEDLKQDRVVNVLPHWAPYRVEVFANWPANAPKNGLIHLFLDEIAKFEYH